MKKICLIIIFLLQGTRYFSQTSNSQVQQQIFSYLKDSLGCASGFPYNVTDLLNRKKGTPHKFVEQWMKDSLQHSRREDYSLD